jgi:hypothetical protein
VRAEAVEFVAGDVRLGGTITQPDSPTPVPGLVLVSGSGPSDRHNGGFFDVLVEHLAGDGICVLTYDKRGVASSTGSWAPATADDLASDAAAAVLALQAHSAVAADQVGVLGHSEGGWVALRMAVRLRPPAHLILNSCPAVSFVESEVFAQTVAGVEHEVAATIMRQLGEAVRLGAGPEHGQRILAAHRGEAWHEALRDSGFVLDATTWSQLTAWVDYDPHDDLMQLAIPTLAVFGERDPLVPVRRSIDRYEQTGVRARRPQHVAVLPDADHRLQTDSGLAPGYLALLSSWCHERGDGTASLDA